MSPKKKKKSDIFQSVYDRILSHQGDNANVSKDLVKSIVEETIEEMKTSLIDGYEIELRGFGAFKFQYRNPRENAHNPRTKEKMFIPGHSVVRFQVGKEIKSAVRDTDYGKKE